MKRKITLVFAALFLSIGAALAQTTVSGTVTSSDDGEPVIGASVMVKGTKTGTVTDIDGHFELTTSQSHPQLVFSYIGMQTQTLKGAKGMKVILHPDNAQQLGEVVVTGMQKMDKRLFTGAQAKNHRDKLI